MRYRRMPIEIESPEQMGYAKLDCNLTESSFADARLSELDLDLSGLLLCYGDHRGKPELRALIAEACGVARADDVLVTAGAASALFIVSTSLLGASDRLLVVRPNYATNIETPRAIGAPIDFLDLSFERGFRLDLDEVARRIGPETRLVSITAPHNPTGTTLSEEELRAIVRLAESRGVLLLVDETYREMAFGAPLPSAASMGARVIAVSSLSKTYGLPGIRIGWLACRDAALMETFLAAKEQIVICNSVVDEEIAHRYLVQRARRLPEIRERIAAHFRIVREWMGAQRALEWVEPSGGVVCFPRMRADSGVDVERFYRVLNEKYKTFVGPGHWFEQERRYMRIGFGWPKTEELQRGLENVARALSEAT
jgi:aspartate/methionine/tyrosine aminotransferase